MNVAVAPVNWDDWRAAYDTMSFDDQQDFYDRVFDVARVQRQHDPKKLGALLDYIAEPVSVVELGGWDGELAATMLAGGQIVKWRNYEISRKAVEASVCDDARYEAIALTDFYWNDQHYADVFVASHVLEHLRQIDVAATLDATKARWVFIAAPLAETSREWGGYHGSHILEIGWRGLMDMLWDRGYDHLDGLSNAGIRCFEKARP